MTGKGKKIAFLGNMNNLNYCIVRYLRDRGMDAHLFLGEEFEHFVPYGDDYEHLNFAEFIHQLDWHKDGHWKIKKDKIRKELEGFDFVAATDRNIAYLYKAGIKIDLFIPHGGDIFYLPFYKFKHFPPKRYEIGTWYQSYQQKKGIQASRNILMDYMNKDFEDVFKKLNYKNNRIKRGFPALYLPTYESEKMHEYADNSELVGKLKEFKKAFDCLIFNNSRLVWTDPKAQSFHYKANDRLLRAVSGLVRENHKIGLVLFETGMDIGATKSLVKELGLEKNVLWFDRLSRKDIIPLMKEADIVSNEFENSWNMGGVITESQLTAKPLLTFRNDKDFSYYEDLYPILNARTEEDIREQILFFFRNPEECVSIGKRANAWLKKNFIEESLEILGKLIKDTYD